MLSNVTLPDGLRQLGSGAFDLCLGLKSINIPASLKNIAPSTFSSCTSIESITVAAGNPVYSTPDNCNALIETILDEKTQKVTKRLVLGCKNSFIPVGVTEIGKYAFNSCVGLTSVTIPGTVTSIGDYAFNNCLNLASVEIPEGVADIGVGVFSDCSSLTSVVIPSTVTSISESLFEYCTGLTTVTLPATLTSIDDDAFYGCADLETIVCLATKCPKLSLTSFDWDLVPEISLSVPESAVDLYEADELWSMFNVEAIGGAAVAPSWDTETAVSDLKGDARIVNVYNLGGQQNTRMQRGINVVRMSDGTTRKILMK